jgi:hypothetical protein
MRNGGSKLVRPGAVSGRDRQRLRAAGGGHAWAGAVDGVVVLVHDQVRQELSGQGTLSQDPPDAAGGKVNSNWPPGIYLISRVGSISYDGVTWNQCARIAPGSPKSCVNIAVAHDLVRKGAGRGRHEPRVSNRRLPKTSLRCAVGRIARAESDTKTRVRGQCAGENATSGT